MKLSDFRCIQCKKSLQQCECFLKQMDTAMEETNVKPTHLSEFFKGITWSDETFLKSLHIQAR